MQTENRVAGGGITFIGLLQVTFIVLKLCNIITWPWTIVLIPICMELGFVIVIVFIWIMVTIFMKH